MSSSDTERASGNRRLALLFLALLILHSIGNSSLPLVDRDEPRFAEASREMLERGDPVVPRFNHRERFDKPPLIYWLQCASYLALGDSEFAARFPSVIAAALTSLLIALWGRRLYDEETGLRAALMLGLCIQMFVHARAAVADMPMVFAVTAAAWSGWEWLRESHPRRVVPAALFWSALAIGFLAKGPIALIPVGMVIAAAQRPGSHRPPLRAWIAGSMLMLAIVGLWGIPALLQTGGRYAEIGLGKHVIERSFYPMESHGASSVAGYLATLPLYFVTIFGSFFPWSMWLWPAAKFYRARESRDDIARYLLTGAALVFAIFTISRTKLPHYILPAFPFIALLLSAWWRRHRPAVLAYRVAAVTAAAFIAISVVLFPVAARWFATEQLYLKAGPDIPSNAVFASVGYQEPSLVWSFRKKTDRFMEELKPEQAAEFLSKPAPRFLVIREGERKIAIPAIDPQWRVFQAEGIHIAKGKRVSVFLILKQ